MYIFNSCIKSKEHFSFEIFVVSSIYFADSTSNIYFCCLWAKALSRMIWRPLGSCLRIWMSQADFQQSSDWDWTQSRRFIVAELSSHTLSGGKISSVLVRQDCGLMSCLRCSWWVWNDETKCFCKVCPVLFQRQMEQEILWENQNFFSNFSSLFSFSLSLSIGEACYQDVSL